MSLARTARPSTIWDRVLCAVDLGPASISAAKIAARLMPAAAKLTMCTVLRPATSEGAAALDEELTREHRNAIDQAQSQIQAIHDVELHLREGPAIQRILDELVAEQATLVTVGARHTSRTDAILLGGVATAILHEAPCPVLIAHNEPTDAGEVVVGFDGSGGARRALAAGRELSERRSLRLRVIVATGDPHPPGPGWSRDELEPELDVTEDPRTAVEALTDASRSAALLVLGSRHLQGVMALSSVSERTTHGAHCPVLVLR